MHLKPIVASRRTFEPLAVATGCWRLNLLLAIVFLFAGDSFAVEAQVRQTAAGRTIRSETTESEPTAEQEKAIAEWIVALGSEQYAMRRQAQIELERIGVPALDQLQQAVLATDPQVAAAAKYMIRSSYIRWTGREDPLNVRKLLEQYGGGDVVHRSERIDKLAALPNDQGIPALLRIARYETSIDLSKRAALAVLTRHDSNSLSFDSETDIASSANDKSNVVHWTKILDSLGTAKGTACGWIRQYAESARDGTPLEQAWWQSAIDTEFTLIDNKSGDSSREIVSEFTRFASEKFAVKGQRSQALELAKNLLRITYSIRERTKVAEDLYLWALEKRLPEIVIDHADSMAKEAEKFGPLPKPNQDPLRDRNYAPFATNLLFLKAEAYRQLKDINALEGKVTKAETTPQLKEADISEKVASTAFERYSISSDTAVFERLYIGDFLRKRSQYDWAERELRKAWDSAIEQHKYEATVCLTLANMLSDGEDYQGAEQALRPLIERFEKEPEFARETDNDSPGQAMIMPEDQAVVQSQRIRAIWLSHRAKVHLVAKRIDEARKDLSEALVCDPENVDLIISMMEIANDETSRKEAKHAFAKVVLAFRETLPRLERGMRNSNSNEIATYQLLYGTALNTYAWLLASTNHDLENALEYSELACRLQPGSSAYLDTLARCHFKNGNRDKAIHLQRQAIAGEPSMRELRRNLEQFLGAE